MNKENLIEKIEERIKTYEKRIRVRQGANYHDESGIIYRFEERMLEALLIKEIIQSEPEEVWNSANECEMKQENECTLLGPCPHHTGLTPEEIKSLHTLIRQQGEEIIKLRKQRGIDISELQNLNFALINMKDERDYWEREAKKWANILGEKRL